MSWKRLKAKLAALLGRRAPVAPRDKGRIKNPYGPGRPFRYHADNGKGTRPPKKPGRYAIVSRAGKEYIGETSNLLKRMGQHRRSGKLRNSEIFDYRIGDSVGVHARRKHEAMKIDRHKPPRNKRRGGGGRKSSK